MKGKEALIRHLAESCAVRGDEQAAQGFVTVAEQSYVQSLSLMPWRVGTLRKLGILYEGQNRLEDARYCFNGALPDSTNEQYFNSDLLASHVISVNNAQGARVFPAWACEQFPLKPPQRLGNTKLLRPFDRPTTRNNGSFTSIVPNASLWFDGFNSLVVDRDQQILSEHIKGNEYLAYLQMLTHTPEHLPGVACFLDTRSSSIYYHWMLDLIPKFGILEKSGISISDIDWFIVDASSRFQAETLTTLGVSTDKLVTTRGKRFFTADKLVNPHLKNDLGEKLYSGLGIGLAGWVSEFLKQIFLEKRPYGSYRGAFGRRLFISRRKASSRRLVNESQLFEYLSKQGFECLVLEEMTVHEQAAAFHSAEAIVATHGAGLTNLAFCQPGTKVLELFNQYTIPCYWALANLNQLDYFQYQQESLIPQASETSSDPRAQDITIDGESWKQIIDQFLNTAQTDRSPDLTTKYVTLN